MDDRIVDHAEVLVDWSARVEAGDRVVLNVDEGAHDLGVAVARKLGAVGASVLSTYGSSELKRAEFRASEGELPEPEHELALYEATDVYLSLGGSRNTSATADVPADRRRAASEAGKATREARLDTDWVSTLHPTRALAQQAGMSYEGYQEFVYGAVLRDWASLAEEMGQLKSILDDGDEVRLVGGDGTTDLRMRIDDRTAVNSAASVAYDSHNLPSGEVFTTPYATEGVVTFDVPMTIRGQRVRDVRLTFEDGTVTDHAAELGESVIGEVLATDEGGRRLGELGIGMNRGIDRITDNILFDEKMAGTVHLALGRAYDATLPAGEAGNDSAIHVDLITDMGEGSRLEVDGEVIQRDGLFRWEEGFEG